MALIPPNQVQTLVLHQCQAIGKGFTAKGALVGLAATMGTLVLVKVQRGAEAAPTVGTDVGTGNVGCRIGAMSALVAVEMGTAAEALATLVARIGLLPGVDAQVPGKMRTPGKALAAVTALEGQPASMEPLVSHQLSIAAETPTTLGTLVGQAPGGQEGWRGSSWGGVGTGMCPLMPI